ncbi:ribosome-binding factor A [Candidatus Kuenenbacteria bacterium]|nr:ribosome-binding factor A [Candidatus Kuenenbacteria bacterium]
MNDRMLQVNSMLQQTLAKILSENLEVPFDFFITVTRFDCGPDLKTANVFVSILPFNKAKDGLAFLIKSRYEIKGLLGKKINLKYTPNLTFIIDDAEEMATKIYSTLDEIKEDEKDA